MKYAVIIYIALGMVLSLMIGVEYNCDGKEMFPTFYGCPFVFMKKSLASSMEYFYSISGLLLNVLIWSIGLYVFDKGMQKIIWHKAMKIGYKVLIGFMIAFTPINIILVPVMNGGGFDESSNYWYWDMDKEAKDWGVTCKGELIFWWF